MWHPLKLIPSAVLIAGLACIVLGAIAVASLEGAQNGRTDLFFIGLILASIGAGLSLRTP
jgi:hypothetical protein